MDPKSTKRVYSTMVVKAVDEDRREITGIASTPGTDRMGDIVVPSGAKFNLPVPLLFQHDHAQPIGQVVAAKVTDAGIEIVARLAKIEAPSQLAARLEEAWQSIKHGLVRGLSIGFRPIKYAFLDDGGIEFSEWDWYELSAVTIPANAEASITSVKSFDTALRASSGTKRDGVVRLDISPAGVSASKQRKSINPTPKEGKDMNIAEQRKAFQEKRKATQEALTALMTKAAEEGRTLDAEEQEAFDGYEAEIKSIDDHLKRLDTFEKAQIEKATPVTQEAGQSFDNAAAARAGKVIEVKHNLPQGVEFARYVKCLAAAKGNAAQAIEIAKAQYPDLPRIQNVLRAAVAAGTTTDPTWAAPLVDYTNFAGDFVAYLRPQTILGRFGQGGIPSLFGVPFNVRIPGQTSGGDAYWVGEGKPKPLTKFDFAATTLGFAKVANIAVLTEELVRFSSPSADLLVRNALAEAIRARLDIDFIDPAKAASAGVSPASITNGVTPIPSSGDPRADVQALMAAFLAANMSPSSGVFIMSSLTALSLSMTLNPLGQREYPDLSLTGGTFFGLPVIVSDHVPTDSTGSLLILVNASDIYLADDGQVVVDASREASLQMADNPTNDSATPTAAQLVSMFQTNSIAIRAERFINWSKRRPQAVAYVSGVDYSNTGS